jgi:XRN-Two Binding Domain, XTBD
MEAVQQKSKTSASVDDQPPTFMKEPTEIETHFKLRKHVYDQALASGLSQDRAYTLAQVFKNAYFMGCQYHEAVLSESKKFWPKKALEQPLYTPLDD